ncbi:MAG: LptF/LptG family permease [Bacteroidota bacterium]
MKHLLKKLDIYIIKKFLSTFFYSLALIIVIVIIFDISEKVDDFIEKHAPLNEIIFQYYWNFIPYFANLFSPLFTFIAVIFFTSKMASHTEIIAMLSSGISYRRIFRPYLISAVLIAIMSFCLANFIIPHSNQIRGNFRNKYIEKMTRSKDRNIHLQLSPGVFAYVEYYDSRIKTASNFSLENISSEVGMFYKITAKNMLYDSITKQWTLNDYYRRTFNGMHEQVETGKQMRVSLPIRPSDFIIQKEDYETMNYAELRTYIEQEKIKGSDLVKFYEVEKHKRLAFPFSTIILTVIGMAVSSKKMRGGIGMHLGYGLIVSFSYILFMQISTTFATFGTLPPIIAVWIPNFIFGVIAVVMFRRMNTLT